MTNSTSRNRLLSLDIFRGATIAAMILVNDPGSWEHSYAQLKHSAWNGWTMTDMIFPFFLWIMGVAMTLSFAKRREGGATTQSLLLHALRRSLIIFVLGIVVNGFPFGWGAPFSWATLRIPGVLQRIAICYFIVSVVFVTTRVRTQVWISALLLAGYWVLVKLVPVPGYGAGVLDPVGSLCWFVDSTLLKGHTWIYAPARGFDPEGIVSTLPAIVTTLFGLLTGHWLRSKRSPEEKAVTMFVAGYVMLLAGVVADIWLPINKNMWTSSYSILMGGWALVCFATVYWLIDIKKTCRPLSAFTVFGMNAITLYVVSELLATLLEVINVSRADGTATTLHGLIYGSLFASWLRPLDASLGFALAYVLVMYAVGWVMWKRGWFVRV